LTGALSPGAENRFTIQENGAFSHQASRSGEAKIVQKMRNGIVHA
jgi:hypothetical protein